MTFSLLAEVKTLEKQVQEALARLATSLNGKPFPPQAMKLARVYGLLAEVRTSLEVPGTPTAATSSARSRAAATDWGTAFRGPLPTSGLPTPAAGDGGSIARAWSDEEEAEARAKLSPPPSPPPRSRNKDTHKDEGDESWQWDER